MTRQIILLLVGLAVLGLLTTAFFLTKEAGIEADRPWPETSQRVPPPPIPVMAHANGEIYIAGTLVDAAGLEREVALMLARAEEGSLPVPSFTIVADPEADNAAIVQIMDAILRGGSSSVSLQTRELD